MTARRDDATEQRTDDNSGERTVCANIPEMIKTAAPSCGPGRRPRPRRFDEGWSLFRPVAAVRGGTLRE